MGNLVQTLRDPNLVLSIQEMFGIRQILLEMEDVKFPLSSSGSSSDEEEPEDSGSIRSSNSSSSTSVQGSLKWLSSKTRVRRKVFTPPPHSIIEEVKDNEPLKKTKTEVLVVETNSFYDTLFRLATECGYEPFYIMMLPMIIWNIDSVVGRHAIMVWGISMYVGQGAKHIFKIRRPASPPVIRLEDNPSLDTEYGFPSTHATVGTSFPFSLLYSFHTRYVVRDVKYLIWIGSNHCNTFI